MANEVSIAMNLAVSKNGASVGAQPSITQSMSGDQMISNVQIIGTTAEALLLGDVSTIGGLYLKNLDAANFVYISLNASPDASNSFAKLLAGQPLFIPTTQTVIYAKADTANVNLQVLAFES